MIRLSISKQAFYDSNLSYSDLPKDLVEISDEIHLELLSKINQGCMILPDLTFSEPSPSQYCEWNGSEWVELS